MKNNTFLKTADLMNECNNNCPTGMQPIIDYSGKFPKFLRYTRGSVVAPEENTSRPNLPSSLR